MDLVESDGAGIVRGGQGSSHAKKYDRGGEGQEEASKHDR
jgi:hypothetical protein